MFYVFTTLTIIIVTLQLTKHWLLSKGSLWWVYRLNCAIFIGYFIVESCVAFNDPTQISLIFMNIVNVWAFTMSCKGIRRLQQEEEQATKLEKEKEECSF